MIVLLDRYYIDSIQPDMHTGFLSLFFFFLIILPSVSSTRFSISTYPYLNIKASVTHTVYIHTSSFSTFQLSLAYFPSVVVLRITISTPRCTTLETFGSWSILPPRLTPNHTLHLLFLPLLSLLSYNSEQLLCRSRPPEISLSFILLSLFVSFALFSHTLYPLFPRRPVLRI